MAHDIAALLGPTNTGKTHRAVERMLEHATGMIGLPLRLLARELYDRITARVGERRVALVTGEEKRVPERPSYWVCTVESMPVDREVDFVCVDEIQMAAHRQRGHTFTDRMLHARGRRETWFLGAETMRDMVSELLPTAQIVGHPRFSRLKHTGAQGLGALPPRSAVVAFSVPEVYELAERLRHRHGGTAVVLGALSPRTRNAQVAMYEAGEVHYMVATDAIGMGLNLDLDRVVFASRRKFDGRETRPLTVSELGQIAGRAGRYTRDGAFGTLKPHPELDPRVAAAIEQHRFDPIRSVVWRNSDLDFSTLDRLVDSLRAPPRRACLRRIERADDFEALVGLARLAEVRRLAVGPEQVALLWDVCRIPDFRKLMLESHLDLLRQVFEQLSRSARCIDVDWMAERIRRLDDVEGGIDALMARMAFIRTWTYITHHEAWVPDAGHWQEVTRAIEDRQSDALHRRLTERFVERVSHGPVRGLRSPSRRRPPPEPEPEPVHEGSPFAVLAGLAVPGGQESAPAEDDVQRLVDAPHQAIEIDACGHLCFEGLAVGRLRRGTDLLHPDVGLTRAAEGLGAGAQSRVLRRLVAWTKDALAELLEPLHGLREADLGPAGRGLVYQLEQSLGSLDRRTARDQLRDLAPRERELLLAAGVVIGRAAVFLPAALEAGPRRLRAALCQAFAGVDPVAGEAEVVALAVPVDEALPAALYPCVGYIVRAGHGIRADALERLAHELARRARGGRFTLGPELSAPLGLAEDELHAVAQSLGYRRRSHGEWEARRRRR